ncbi:hypothetical protein [Mucilaginibacter psychrotolerans]|uniref:Lipoprotein n=1 Tax=Mucilaginibacter psychrotolerans TaxID=1524096 RepID=A0A4Y8S6E8_9SPHI|nr:hypothetical protein [Mucilaginibacter psychrotolerans]TFF33964.1 hypothetical protein E2R66_23580 [Mucilaginibacter psychrotolerans]
MKKHLFFITIVFSIFTSCSKSSGDQSPAEIQTQKVQQLERKYGLQRLTTNQIQNRKNTRQFNSLDELERYLAGKPQTKAFSEVKGIMELKESGNSDVVGGKRLDATYSGSGPYSATLTLTNSEGYPDKLALVWSANSAATGTLYFTGSNAGSFTWIQKQGYDFNHTVYIRGDYIETFGVNGLYTWSKAYDFSFEGGWGAGQIGGSATYTPKANGGSGGGE